MVIPQDPRGDRPPRSPTLIVTEKGRDHSLRSAKPPRLPESRTRWFSGSRCVGILAFQPVGETFEIGAGVVHLHVRTEAAYRNHPAVSGDFPPYTIAFLSGCAMGPFESGHFQADFFLGGLRYVRDREQVISNQ